MKIRDLINVVARKMSKYTLAKKIFKNSFNAYKKRRAKRMLDNFHQYGLEALKTFDDCLTENGFRYTLAFGTLLGAIREHGFIPHDDDIDVTMRIEDYSPEIIRALRSKGFIHRFSYSVDNDRYAKEDTFEYKGVLLDIFYVYDDIQGNPYCCYFDIQPGCITRSESVKKHGGLFTRKIFLASSKDIVRIPFCGIEVPIPANYDTVLKRVFGESYMTPIPGWTHDDYCEPMPEWLCKYKEY